MSERLSSESVSRETTHERYDDTQLKRLNDIMLEIKSIDQAALDEPARQRRQELVAEFSELLDPIISTTVRIFLHQYRSFFNRRGQNPRSLVDDVRQEIMTILLEKSTYRSYKEMDKLVPFLKEVLRRGLERNLILSPSKIKRTPPGGSIRSLEQFKDAEKKGDHNNILDIIAESDQLESTEEWEKHIVNKIDEESQKEPEERESREIFESKLKELESKLEELKSIALFVIVLRYGLGKEKFQLCREKAEQELQTLQGRFLTRQPILMAQAEKLKKIKNFSAPDDDFFDATHSLQEITDILSLPNRQNIKAAHNGALDILRSKVKEKSEIDEDT